MGASASCSLTFVPSILKMRMRLSLCLSSSWHLSRPGVLRGRLASRLLQQAGDIEREIGQYAVCACALESKKAFEHHRVVVEPSILGSGLEHRVLAADLVGEGRHAELVLDP